MRYTIPDIVKSANLFLQHNGRRPHQRDRTQAIGIGVTWHSIDCYLRKYADTSLSRVLTEAGVKNPGSTALTMDMVKWAIQFFREEHGKFPSANSGDASRWFPASTGRPTWSTINSWLDRNHGISLCDLRD